MFSVGFLACFFLWLFLFVVVSASKLFTIYLIFVCWFLVYRAKIGIRLPL